MNQLIDLLGTFAFKVINCELYSQEDFQIFTSRLNMKNYNSNNDYDLNEFLNNLPDAVIEVKGIKMVKLDAVIGLLVNAVNELREKVEAN